MKLKENKVPKRESSKNRVDVIENRRENSFMKWIHSEKMEKVA